MKAWKDHFDTHGYVAIEGFMTPSEIDTVRERMEAFIRTRVDQLPPEHVFYEVKGAADTLKQLQHLDQHDLWFRELFTSEKVTSLADLLLGAPAAGKNMQWFNKPPAIGKETPPHQDGYYFMLEPNEALTMWLALDYVDPENGCVRYIPGSHKAGMRAHGKTGVLGFSQGILDYSPEDISKEIPMIVKPGDLLVHHSLTIHRADANSSSRTRKGLGFIFYSTVAKEDRERHETYQEELRQELIRSNKI